MLWTSQTNNYIMCRYRMSNDFLVLMREFGTAYCEYCPTTTRTCPTFPIPHPMKITPSCNLPRSWQSTSPLLLKKMDYVRERLSVEILLFYIRLCGRNDFWKRQNDFLWCRFEVIDWMWFLGGWSALCNSSFSCSFYFPFSYFLTINIMLLSHLSIW